MTVTFIAHSAYLVEWDKFYTLFDYTYEPDYTGALPELNPEKPLLVFASHSHEDHFDAKVFTLLEKYPDARFFVSRDTRLVSGKLPSITGFSATDRDGIDRTDSLLALEHVYLVTCFDMEASHPEGWEAVLRYLAHQDTPVVVLANTDQGEAVERLAIPFPIYFTDPVTLKTILRSNPGVVELKRGVVVSKRSCFELKNED